MSYDEFIGRRMAYSVGEGIDDARLSDRLFPHQRDLVSWALRRGRAAIFADTGLGKTLMQLEWARVVSERLGRVIVLTPLAVAKQTVREGNRFGIACEFDQTGSSVAPIVVTNYEHLDKFAALSLFGGVVIDESSILKNYTGATRNAIIEAFSQTPMRLACTATPAPNDHMELGNHSEFLGVKTRTEMLAEYFTHDGGSTQDWRLKGHAEDSYWRWVCSWAAMVRMPSDLGYEDGDYKLPPMRMHEHVIPVDHRDAWSAGYLFAPDATTLSEQRATRRMTLGKRAAKVAELIGGSKWPGNQSTTKQETERRHQTQITGQRETSSEAQEARTTCETGTQRTGKGSRNTGQRQPTRETQEEESCTQPTKRGAKKQESQQGKEIHQKDSTQGCDPASEYQQKNTQQYLRDRGEPARSAGATEATGSGQGFLSIIATAQEGSEGSCAAAATLALESSKTISLGLSEQSHTSRDPWIVWAELNDEQDAIEKALVDAGISVVSISGSMSHEQKESMHEQWINGRVQVLVSKPSIFGHGLNWQHCASMIFAGASHSYEQTYQAIRRCWRFGQKRPVDVHVIRAETESAITQNFKRKEADAERMRAAMLEHMRDAQAESFGRRVKREWNAYNPQVTMTIPSWIGVEQ